MQRQAGVRSLVCLVVSLFGTVLGFGSWARGEGPTDRDHLLPSGTTLYFRWHPRADFDELWRGSQAHEGLVRSGLVEFIERLLTPENLAGLLESTGLPAEQTGLAEQTARQFLAQVAEHGLLVGGDVRPLTGELTVVLPQGAGTELAGRIDSMVRAYAESSQLEVKEQALFNRAVAVLKVESFFISWWNEDKDLVISINQLGPNRAVGRAAGKSDGYPKSPRYASFKRKRDYAVVEEMWVDVEPLVKLLPGAIPEIRQMIDLVGAKGLQGLILTTGFEGKRLRTDWDILLAKERSGLLSIVGGPALSVEKLPAIPADTDFAYATTINWTKVYDEVFASLAKLAEIYPDMGLATAPAMVESVEEQLGYKLRDEIFASLADEIVLYQSPTDGPLFTGVSLAVGVKDAELIEGAIDRIVDMVGLLDSKFLLEKTERDGIKYWIAGYAESSIPMAPTLALGKNWLVASAISPASVTRFFELQQGSSSTSTFWSRIDTKGPPGTVTGLIYHDPKRAIEFGASFLPMVAAGLRNMPGGVQIDLTRTPRADIIVGSVEPGTAVTTFDAEGLHGTSRYSLPLTNPEWVAPIYGMIVGSLWAVGMAPPETTLPFVEEWNFGEDEEPTDPEPGDEAMPEPGEAPPAEPEGDAEPNGEVEPEGGEPPTKDDMTRAVRRRPAGSVTYWR